MSEYSMKVLEQRFLSRQTGVVLVSTLLVIAIVSVIAMFHMENARKNLRTAFDMKTKITACMQADSIVNDVVFRLLTLDYSEVLLLPLDEDSEVGWNYFSQPFLYQGAEVQLQDLAGFISVAELNGSLARMYYKQSGLADRQISAFWDSLGDWQDGDDFRRIDGAERQYYLGQGREPPPNLTIRSLTELKKVKGYPVVLDQLMESGLQLYTQNHFNPMTAPPLLLDVLLGESLSQKVQQKRLIGDLAPLEFRSMTGLTNSESMLFVPGPEIRITVVATADRGVKCDRQVVLEKNGNVSEPFALRPWY